MNIPIYIPINIPIKIPSNIPINIPINIPTNPPFFLEINGHFRLCKAYAMGYILKIWPYMV